MEIEKAGKYEVDGIFLLERKCFGDESFSKQQFRYLLQRAKSECFVVRKTDQIIAYMILLNHKKSKGVRIYSIAIDPDYRGLGFAKKLIDKAENVARKVGKQYLNLEVKENNLAAINLYLKEGFFQTGSKGNYYKDGLTAITMKKTL